MTHEKIIKRDDGAQVKIKVTMEPSAYFAADTIWETEVWIWGEGCMGKNC
jgi:hypothetical protein